MGKRDETYSDKETTARRDTALLRALKTPPKSHEDMKLGKAEKKPKAKKKSDK